VQEVEAIAEAIVNFSPNRLTAVVAVECKNDEVVKAVTLLRHPSCRWSPRESAVNWASR
jgi:hypothetical protein